MIWAPDGAETEVLIAASHPAFAGHFPDAPVLPGVVLLTLALEAAQEVPSWAARLGAAPRIDQVKFLAPVGPGQTLRIGLRARGDGLDFDVRCGGTAVARGRLSAGEGA